MNTPTPHQRPDSIDLYLQARHRRAHLLGLAFARVFQALRGLWAARRRAPRQRRAA